jgi:hypothetical protein
MDSTEAVLGMLLLAGVALAVRVVGYAAAACIPASGFWPRLVEAAPGNLFIAQLLSRYPVLNIHATTPRHSAMNNSVMARLMPTLDVGHAVEAPAEAADQVDHRVEQGDLLPERRQHVDGIEAAAQEGERRDDQRRDELQLLEAVGPDADDETQQAEGHRRQHQEQQHEAGCIDPHRHEQRRGRQDDEAQRRWTSSPPRRRS